MKTLHPQWGGYGYTWWRHLNAIQPAQFERGDEYEQLVLNSPIGYLIRLSEASSATHPPEEAGLWLHLRRRLSGAEAQVDFPDLEKLAAAGATDYSPRSSASVLKATPHMEQGSAIPLRPTGPRASTTMTSCC
jgi:adenylate cyclase